VGLGTVGFRNQYSPPSCPYVESPHWPTPCPPPGLPVGIFFAFFCLSPFSFSCVLFRAQVLPGNSKSFFLSLNRTGQYLQLLRRTRSTQYFSKYFFTLNIFNFVHFKSLESSDSIFLISTIAAAQLLLNSFFFVVGTIVIRRWL
jgi:hypothetical protein